jgi:hypothetical protein
MDRLNRDLARIGGLLIGTAAFVGAAITWVGLELVERHHAKPPLPEQVTSGLRERSS